MSNDFEIFSICDNCGQQVASGFKNCDACCQWSDYEYALNAGWKSITLPEFQRWQRDPDPHPYRYFFVARLSVRRKPVWNTGTSTGQYIDLRGYYDEMRQVLEKEYKIIKGDQYRLHIMYSERGVVV